MDNGNIAAVDGRRIHCLKLSRSLEHVLYSEFRVLCKIGSACDRNFRTVRLYNGAVVNVRTADYLVSDDGIKSSARLVSQLLCSFNDHGINACHFKHIAELNVIAVLVDGGGHGDYGQA